MKRKKRIDYKKLWDKFSKKYLPEIEREYIGYVAIDFAKICVKQTTKRKKRKHPKKKEEINKTETNKKLESKKAVFLDRDGVINKLNKEHTYIKYCSDLKRKMFPDVAENIKILKKAGYMVFIITNQAGINKGIIPKKEYNKMLRYLSEIGIDMVYTCPHNYLKEKCDCRKPSPKMILQASNEWNIDLKQSWMVGDDKTDLETGRRAGCNVFEGNLQELIDFMEVPK